MPIPAIQELGRLACIRPNADNGDDLYLARVSAIFGDYSTGETIPESYKVDDDRCPFEGIPAAQVYPVVQVTMPDGDRYAAVIAGTVQDMARPGEPITSYLALRVNALAIGAWVDPAWTQPL